MSEVGGGQEQHVGTVGSSQHRGEEEEQVEREENEGPHTDGRALNLIKRSLGIKKENRPEEENHRREQKKEDTTTEKMAAEDEMEEDKQMLPNEFEEEDGNVKKAKAVLQELRNKHTSTSLPVYRMNNKKRGTAAIFNIGKSAFAFSDEIVNRSGYELDGYMMKSVWADLGFEVKYYEDVSSAELTAILDDLAALPHDQADCFVLVLMSHGTKGALGEDTVYTTDGPYSLQLIVKKFKASNTKSLIGKPKLFFVQACRGDRVDRGEIFKDVVTDSKAVRHMFKVIPVEADILLSQSSVKEYVSFRHPESGSVYIKYLAHALSEYGEQKDIQWILTKVNSLVAEEFKGISKEDGYIQKQMPVFTSMLTKQLIFKN